MLGVEKKIALVKYWLNNLKLRAHDLSIKYIMDKEGGFEVEIAKSNIIWSVLIDSPDFAPYKNILIEIIDLDDIDNYYILSWGDDSTTSEEDIINKLNESIAMVIN